MRICAIIFCVLLCSSVLGWSIDVKHSIEPTFNVPNFWGAYGCYNQVWLTNDNTGSIHFETKDNQQIIMVSSLDANSEFPSEKLFLNNLDDSQRIKQIPISDNEVLVFVFDFVGNNVKETIQEFVQELCAVSVISGTCKTAVPKMMDSFIWQIPKEHITTGFEKYHDIIRSSIENMNQAVDPVNLLLNQVSEQSQRQFLSGLTSVHTRLSTAGAVTLQASYYLFGLLQGFGLDPFMYYFDANYPPNVCADITGKLEPEKLIIVGAHYDDRMSNITDTTARAPGANDDGSGCALLQEIIKIMSSTPYNYRYTIRYCFWAGEEQGLVGSSAYATTLKNNNTDVVAMLQADMIAYLTPGGAYQVDMAIRETDLTLTSLLNSITSTYVPSLLIGNTTSCCTDSQSFTAAGYSSAAYNEPGGYTIDPQYHSVLDVVNRPGYNLTLLGLITQSVLAATAILAEII